MVVEWMAIYLAVLKRPVQSEYSKQLFEFNHKVSSEYFNTRILPLDKLKFCKNTNNLIFIQANLVLLIRVEKLFTERWPYNVGDSARQIRLFIVCKGLFTPSESGAKAKKGKKKE